MLRKNLGRIYDTLANPFPPIAGRPQERASASACSESLSNVSAIAITAALRSAKALVKGPDYEVHCFQLFRGQYGAMVHAHAVRHYTWTAGGRIGGLTPVGLNQASERCQHAQIGRTHGPELQSTHIAICISSLC